MNRVCHINNRSGFTLVELMVAMVITFLITGAAYASYIIQQRSYTAQEQVILIQQNIRTGLNIMTREMRMAGYDPSFSDLYGVVTANANTFNFTADLCSDGGDPGKCVLGGESITETYLYELYDSSGDGVNDSLRRTPAGSAIAENIEQLEFRYTLEDGTQTQAPTAIELGQIVTVEVSVLARAEEEDHFYNNSSVYTSAAGTNYGPFDDKFRRRMLNTTIQLRNMGI